MSEYIFRVNLDSITSLECFKEASKDELKVLVALISHKGRLVSADSLARELEISKARVSATITLFEESSVITKVKDEFLAEVEYEFEPSGDKKSENAKEVARSIRDNDLYEMNVEMERLLEKTLEAREIARITSLYTKKGLSPEFILTLTAYLKDKVEKLSVERIVREANKLTDNKIDTLEELELYIKEKSEEVAGEMEMRNLFGIRGRTLTKSEREFFKRWMHEFAYSVEIIGEAYDITVNATGDKSLSYMDKILLSWHESNCKTLEECRAKAALHKYKNSKNANNNSQKSKKNVEVETPKYTDFNSEDALMRALERSYGDSDGN